MKTLARLGLITVSAGLATACSTPAPTADGMHYRCESGASITASYPDTDTARLSYQGHTHVLKIAVSGSGSRYVGDGIEWWTKGAGPGSEGTLMRHLPDGTSGDLLQLCTAR